MTKVQNPAPRASGNRADLIKSDVWLSTAESQSDQAKDSWQHISAPVLRVLDRLLKRMMRPPTSAETQRANSFLAPEPRRGRERGC